MEDKSEGTGQEVRRRVEGFRSSLSALTQGIASKDRVEQVNIRHTWEVKLADLDGKLKDGEWELRVEKDSRWIPNICVTNSGAL